jgi:UDP-glucose 4-epimerase
MVLRKIALTGASGMVGYHILELLASRGISCIATSRSRSIPMQEGVSWFPWDLRENRDMEELDLLFTDVDGVLHLGAIVPNSEEVVKEKDIFDVNMRSCLLLGQWARMRKVPLVFLSSSTVYANQNKSGIKENDKKTYNGFGGFYGLTKLLAEEIFQHLQKEGLKLTILRPSSIYGYGLHHTKMIATFLHQASRGETIELYPPTDDRIDLIHGHDVARAMLDVLEKEVYGIFNIASGIPHTLLEIAQACVDVVGKGSIKIVQKRIKRKPLSRFVLCCDAARYAFMFSPQISLVDGVRLMWQKCCCRNVLKKQHGSKHR